MNFIENLGLKTLHQMDPERGHHLSLTALKYGLVPLAGLHTSDRLKTNVAGLNLPNPVGLAAGFDKNAIALAPLSRAGFGFVEVGAATPRPQPGNPKPRLFRLTQDQAAINRFGFNNEGMEAIGTRLAARQKGAVPIGLNLGANKDSDDRAQDFVRVLKHCGPFADFATVNVSSPNTEKLRDLQGTAALHALLSGVMEAREGLSQHLPVFLKIAPDLTDDELAGIAEVALSTKVSGIITTNTTLSRDGLQSPDRGETGGLSGAPLFEKSTRVLARMSQLTDGKLPLIGVGGIATADQAWAKIRAGASAVQVYTALVYRGFSMVNEIVTGLDKILAREGFANIQDAVGSGRNEWL